MNEHRNEDDQSHTVQVLAGRTFDGVPFPISLDVTREIAHGASARIYKGEVLAGDRLVVAVKLFGTMLGHIEQEILVRELQVARQVSLRHPLILAFLGTADTGQHTSIVSLYMRNGNMMDYMKSHPGCDKKALIVQVAQAVNYLHADEGLVHGDLKCENVLISDYGEALLADFGLSTFVEKTRFTSATMTGIRQKYTPRFAAPEVMLERAVQSKTRESDVYAFGMLVLQAVTEQLPWGVDINDIAIILQVASGSHPRRPTSGSGFVSLSHHWWDICKSSWSRIPSHRPRMAFVLDELTHTGLHPYRQVEGHTSTVRSVAYLPGGRRVVSGLSDGTISICDTLTGRIVVGPFCGHDGRVLCVAVSPDGLHICSAGEDHTIRRWDAESGAPIAKLTFGLDEQVNNIEFAPDGMRIVSYSPNRTVHMWDAITGEALGDLLGSHAHCVVSVAFSPDGECIASGSYDGTVRLWDGATLAVIGVLQAGNSLYRGTRSVCFSPDRIHLVSGCNNGAIRIWNISTRQIVRNIQAHAILINAVAVSPSGSYIASVSHDESIRIWNAQTGDAVGAPLTGHTGWIYSFAFSMDGRSLVSGSDDGTVRAWDLFE